MKILLSIKPKFANLIFSGDKCFEYRKRTFKRTDIDTVIVYASSPVKQVIGVFKISSILLGSKDLIWIKTAHKSGILQQYFYKYYEKHTTACAIGIKDPVLFDKPKQLSDYGIKKAPQSYCYVND